MLYQVKELDETEQRQRLHHDKVTTLPHTCQMCRAVEALALANPTTVANPAKGRTKQVIASLETRNMTSRLIACYGPQMMEGLGLEELDETEQRQRST